MKKGINSLIFSKRNLFIFFTTIFIVFISVCAFHIISDNFARAKFRTMQDKIASSEGVNLTGLDKLSASGAPFMDLATLKTKLTSVERPIIIVDNMREHNGYINGIPTTYFGYHCHRFEFRYLIRRLIFTGTSQPPKPERIVSTRNMAKEYGLGYVNLRIDSQSDTPDMSIDNFVAFIDKNSDNAWLHFNCRGGKGRTSLSLVMFDIMKNAPQVALEDIIKRQYLLGSVDLSDTTMWKKNSTYSSKTLEQRKKFIQNFYTFVCQRKEGGIQVWSEWKGSNE